MKTIERHNPWQSTTALLGIGSVIEDLWERVFPEIHEDHRKVHDYRRIIMLIHAGYSSGEDLTVLRFKRVLEEHLALSPNRVDQRLARLFELGVIEKVPNPKNRRQKLLKPSQDALKKLMHIGDEMAQYARHMIELLATRGKLPAAVAPEDGHLDPLPRFNGAAVINV